MRFLLLKITLLASLSSFGQLFKITSNQADTTKIYKIDSLSNRGILLNNPWKFTYQDSVSFSKNEFDDTKWENINLDAEFSEFPKIDKNTIGWFRKKIFIDSSLVNQPLIFSINIKGAATLFINGKKIHEIGRIPSKNKQAVLNYFKGPLPYTILFDKAGEQTLSIRFVFSHTNSLFDKYDLFPMSIRLRRLDGYVENSFFKEHNERLIFGIAIGFFLMMAFIHFFFYNFFRSEKYNLPMSIAMVLFGLNFYLANSFNVYTSKAIFLNVLLLQNILWPLAHIVMLMATYDYLKYPKRLLFWSVVLAFFIIKGLTFFEIIDSVIFPISLYSGLIINYIYLIWKAIKNGNPSGKVMQNAAFTLMASAAIFIVILIGIAIVFSGDLVVMNEILLNIWLPIFVDLFIVGPQLAISGAISFSLAKEFVKTNNALLKNLKEIEKLSNEKQQILTNQNQILEKLVTERTTELHRSLVDLKATQTQLIQSEKLASLGELTAGIAHEIQNPLNFVNNFSELSVDLAKELDEEMDKEIIDKDLAKELMSDLILNQEKINLHGKRASSIVKGMLEHSRQSTGERTLTDINQLADEYLRLSYHGIRAKDSSFNSDYKTEFDENLPKIEVIPQDMGRVLLNLINNAFWAVKTVEKPLVVVKTEQSQNQLIIKVTDNGTGMTDDVKAKIFQPFFTTKPTGQGTGLGLSLSYDIVTKGHGGAIEVESLEGEGTTFIVKLPIS